MAKDFVPIGLLTEDSKLHAGAVTLCLSGSLVLVFPFGMVIHFKTISTDAYLIGWGAVYKNGLACGSWKDDGWKACKWYANCL